MYARWAWLGLLLWTHTAWALPQIQHWTLENGGRVYFVESRELPMLQISAVFDAGSAREAADKPGLALLTNQLLREGAGALDADQIAVGLEGLGAQLSLDSSRDMASVNLRSLSDPNLLERAVAIFSQILHTPTFPQPGLERERRSNLIALQKINQSPSDLASKTLLSLLYGQHPYARDPLGTEAGLQAITRADLVAHHQRYYVGANMVVAIVGDLRPAAAKRLTARLFGGLRSGERPPPLPPVADASQEITRHIAFPSSQSHILSGAPGMTRTDPDYFPLLVGNHVLGGSGLVSRLFEEIREKHGLSYSVYSSYSPLRERGPFVVGLQTKNAQRAQALGLMRQTLADFAANGPTEEELKAAKKNLTGGFPLRIDSNRRILDYLALIGFYGLPLNFLEEFIPRIEAVTAEQIRAAFKRRLHPQRMVTVIVGGETP